MLRPYTANAPSRARLLLKIPDVPGHELGQPRQGPGHPDAPDRDARPAGPHARLRLRQRLLRLPGRPPRGARCLGITIHEWERQNCEEMRDFLGVPEERDGVPR